MNHSSHKLYFDTILRDLPSFSPEVRAERLRKFMSMLQKKLQAHNTADEADKPHRSDKSLATHVYETIEDYIRGMRGQTADKVRTAADWCVAKLITIPRNLANKEKKQLLLQEWANDSDPPVTVHC